MNDTRISSATRSFDAVVVGAGFAGLYMLHRLRGLGLSVRVFEAGGDIGGTWFWNRYPGARCDVASMEYSYQFSDALQQEWDWSERYATQPEILRYIHHVAERFDLRKDIQLDTRVSAATYDETTQRWGIDTDTGERVSARFCIFATGCLSVPITPRFPDMERFAGAIHHTGRWPHQGVDFSGQRVAVIGTGSSAIQSVPLIAEQAAQLVVFQRTPTYSVPAHNVPLDREVQASVKANYAAMRAQAKQTPFGFAGTVHEGCALDASAEERRSAFEASWQVGGLHFVGTYADLLFSKEANDTAVAFIREKIRGIVDDPEIAERLSPRHVVGCKRTCVDTGYYQTYNRPNVTLVDVGADPIVEITATGVRTQSREHACDAIVLATGFDAMTGALLRVDIRGRDGLPLQQAWSAGPRSYLGLAIAGYPNLFTITGPGSPSVLTNMLPSIEQHVDWIADCIAYLSAQGYQRIEADAAAQDAWVAHVNDVAGSTLLHGCGSWYLGANVPGKPRVFMPYLGFPAYVQKCKSVVAAGYAGFKLAR